MPGRSHPRCGSPRDEPRSSAATQRAALGIARAISADTASDHDLKLSALDLEGRAHDFLGDRDAARATWERQAREALAAGRTQAQLRAVVQLGKIELFAGQPPNRLYEAVDLAREAGALVELGWAQENLAIALGIQGDLPAARALLGDAIATCRALRLDQLAYLLASFAATSSYVTNEGIEETLAEAEALMDTTDLRLHTSSIRADIAFRARRYDDALEWLDASREILRTLPWCCSCRLAVLESVGARGCGQTGRGASRSRRGAADARPRALVRPERRRWRRERRCSTATRKASTAPWERRRGACRSTSRSMRLLAAELLAGESAVRWLREALDLYENGRRDARRGPRPAGAPRRRRACPAPAPSPGSRP